MSDEPLGVDEPLVETAAEPAPELGRWERAGMVASLVALVGGILTWYAAVDTVWFALKFGDSAQRIEAAKRLSSEGADGLLGLQRLLVDTDPDVRLAAVKAVATLAPTTPDALTALSRRIDDENAQVRLTAVRALSSFAGTEPLALDQIVSLLQQKSGAVRKAAASALPAFGAEAGRAVVPLIRAGNDWQRSHPRATREQNPFKTVMMELGTQIIPGLTAASDHNRRAIRIQAAQQLVRLREHKPARDALHSLISCPYDDVRVLATRWAVNPKAPTLEELKSLIRLLSDELTRAAAAEALSTAGERLAALQTIDAQTGAELIPILLESDSVPGGIAAKLLAAMGPMAVDALRQGVISNNETARLRAVEALSYQGALAVKALPELRIALQNHGIHLPVIRVLREMGKPGIPLLLEVAAFRDLEVQRAAVAAVGHTGIATPSALRILGQGLQKSSRLRSACTAALLKLGPDGIRRLAKDLLSDELRIQLHIAEAIAKFSGDGSPALSFLLRIRKRKSTRLRAFIVQALAKHGRDSPEVRRALFEMIDDRSVRVRAALAQSLAQWRGDSEAIQRVEKLKSDRYAQVREAAQKALSQNID